VSDKSNNHEQMKPLDFSQFPHVIHVDDEIVLNDFTAQDAHRLTEIASDEAVQTYIPGAKEDMTAYIARTSRNRDFRGPRYAIRYKDELAGHFAIFPSPDVLGVIEMGYVLAIEQRGNGVVSRIMPIGERLVGQYLPNMKVGLCINDENDASKRTATRMGFVPTDTISGGDRLYLKGKDV
jgi:RimJ/RimL family protein N-acetyltransferase